MPSLVTLADFNQNQVGVTPFASLQATIDAQITLLDTFDGVTFDPNNWILGGTVPPTCNGAAIINPGTAASASTSLVSSATFSPSGAQTLGIFLTAEAGPIALGNHRWFGIGTQPGGWTAATPIQNGLGFEIDTSGALRSSVYSNGTRGDTQILTIPTDGKPHALVMVYRPGITFFYLDNLVVPVFVSNQQPLVQALPIRLHSINGLSTTTGTPTYSGTALGFADASRPSSAQSDGVYPYRRQTVYPSGTSFSSQVTTEGQRSTYRYAVSGFTPVATPTAFAIIQGSATKVVRIKRIYVSGVATAAGNLPLLVTRRSTAGTQGGATLTAVTPGKHDPNDAAPTAVISTVSTANFTALGTSAGQLASSRIGLAAVGTGVADSPALYDFATRNDKALILRGTSDFITLEGAGAAVPAGGALDIEIETEEDSF